FIPVSFRQQGIDFAGSALILPNAVCCICIGMMIGGYKYRESLCARKNKLSDFFRIIQPYYLIFMFHVLQLPCQEHNLALNHMASMTRWLTQLQVRHRRLPPPRSRGAIQATTTFSSNSR